MGEGVSKGNLKKHSAPALNMGDNVPSSGLAVRHVFDAGTYTIIPSRHRSTTLYQTTNTELVSSTSSLFSVGDLHITIQAKNFMPVEATLTAVFNGLSDYYK